MFVSLLAGTVIFLLKILAWWRTGSTAILSDALESIVNVVAAGFALFAVHVAERPADEDHPYGHGKVEHLSAAFEGGLIGFAGIAIVVTSVRSLSAPPALKEMDVGMVVTGLAAAGNLVLGGWLVRRGKKLESPTLLADGHHVLTDVWTTVGAIVAVFVVRVTRVAIIDPIVAALLGLWLTFTAIKLVRRAADGLMDREDPALLERVVAAFNAESSLGLGGLHRLRAIRAGDFVHVDAHVYAPGDWSLAQTHDALSALEVAVRAHSGLALEFVLHVDPAPEGFVVAPVTVAAATHGPRDQ